MRNGEAYARDEWNTRANAPSPRLSKSSVQKWGAYLLSLPCIILVGAIIYFQRPLH